MNGDGIWIHIYDNQLKHSNPNQYNTIQYNTNQYNTNQYNTIQYNTNQYNTNQYNTIQYNTIQYNTIQYNTTIFINAKHHTSKSKFNFFWINQQQVILITSTQHHSMLNQLESDEF